MQIDLSQQLHGQDWQPLRQIVKAPVAEGQEPETAPLTLQSILQNSLLNKDDKSSLEENACIYNVIDKVRSTVGDIVDLTADEITTILAVANRTLPLFIIGQLVKMLKV